MGSNPLGVMCIFLILARRRLYGGMGMGMSFAGRGRGNQKGRTRNAGRTRNGQNRE
jgi:hypothetical protein